MLSPGDSSEIKDKGTEDLKTCIFNHGFRLTLKFTHISGVFIHQASPGKIIFICQLYISFY